MNGGHGGHGGHGNNNNPKQLPLPKELWASLPDPSKSTISQHNCQYQTNTAQQDNAGHIPKATWEQLPPHAKSFQMHNVIPTTTQQHYSQLQ